MFSIEAFYKEYETVTTDVVIGGRKFEILLPASLDRFIDHGDVLNEFPLWAKIWQASVVLAEYLAQMPIDSRRRLLEIGAGLGLVSIVAADVGHPITMTEYDAHALQFARANAHRNGCPQLPVTALDWHRPVLPGKFDIIVGSEVIFKEADLKPLLELFRTYLKPKGEVILAGEMRRTSKEFFNRMQQVFHIKAQKKILRSADEEIQVFLFRMTFKNPMS